MGNFCNFAHGYMAPSQEREGVQQCREEGEMLFQRDLVNKMYRKENEYFFFLHSNRTLDLTIMDF